MRPATDSGGWDFGRYDEPNEGPHGGLHPFHRGGSVVTERREALQALAEAVAPDQAVSVPAAWLLGLLAQVDAAERVRAPAEGLLTVDQTAARMRVSPGYLYRRAKSLPFAVKLSHRVLRFDPKGLEEWMAARARAGRVA